MAESTSSVCGGTGGLVEGDNTSSGDEESGNIDEKTRESEDSQGQQVTIPLVLYVIQGC
jgi:hypothetical protein